MLRVRRKLRYKELRNLHSLPNIIKTIKTRRVKWIGNVVRIGRKGVHFVFWCESRKERDHSEDLDVNGKVILRCVLRHFHITRARARVTRYARE
jgi:hypothetical protein